LLKALWVLQAWELQRRLLVVVETEMGDSEADVGVEAATDLAAEVDQQKAQPNSNKLRRLHFWLAPLKPSESETSLEDGEEPRENVFLLQLSELVELMLRQTVIQTARASATSSRLLLEVLPATD
jgi:hypothetical protein